MKDHILWGREESLDHQVSYHGEMEASKGAGRNKHRARGNYPGTHSESSNHQGVHRHWSTQINTNRKERERGRERREIKETDREQY